MTIYYYQPPITISSTKECEVINEEGVIIGSVQRYFKSFVHQLLNSLIGKHNLIVRVRAMNPERQLIIDANTQMAMIKRPYYYLRFIAGTWHGVAFRAIQTNNININAEFSIQADDQLEITVKQTSLNDVLFYENQYEIAHICFYLRPNKKTTIEIDEQATIQDPLFYIVFHHLLFVIGY